MPEIVLILIDLLATGFEVWGLIFLMRNEKRKHGTTGVFLFWLMIVLGIFAMTRIGFPIRLKLFCIAVMMMCIGKIAYACEIIKFLLFALIFTLALDASEVIAIQLWNLFNDPIYSNNIIYEEFTLALIIFAHTFFIFTILILESIIRGQTKKDILEIFCQF